VVYQLRKRANNNDGDEWDVIELTQESPPAILSPRMHLYVLQKDRREHKPEPTPPLTMPVLPQVPITLPQENKEKDFNRNHRPEPHVETSVVRSDPLTPASTEQTPTQSPADTPTKMREQPESFPSVNSPRTPPTKVEEQRSLLLEALVRLTKLVLITLF